MSVTYCEGVGWSSLLAFWINDVGEDSVDISVSGGSGATDLDLFSATMGHTGLAVGITQRHVVGIANAIQGVSADPAVFAMPAVAATMGETVAAPGLVQQHNLTAVNAAQGHTATIAVQGVVLHLANADMICAGLAVSLQQQAPGASLDVANASMDVEGLAVELFTPTMLPDIHSWAAPESGVLVTAGVVSQWTDKSGADNHWTVNGSVDGLLLKMPTHASAVANGHNAVKFDGANDGLRVSAGGTIDITHAANWSMSMVQRSMGSAATNSRACYFGLGVTGGVQSRLEFIVTAANHGIQIRNSAGTVILNRNLTTLSHGASGAWRVMRFVKAGSAMTMYHNGAVVTADSQLNVAANPAQVMFIGATYTSALPDNRFFNGEYAEVIVQATAITSVHGRELDKLLGAKYGVSIT